MTYQSDDVKGDAKMSRSKIKMTAKKEDIKVHDLYEMIDHHKFLKDDDKERNYWINIDRLIKMLK